jgi:uncharacterized DUF497 family protein
VSPKTPRFDWDEANIAHIARHGVVPSEVEESFRDPFQILLKSYYRNGERRYDMLGETVDGRILEVVFITRGAAIRTVTAYTAKKRDRAVYLEARREQTL